VLELAVIIWTCLWECLNTQDGDVSPVYVVKQKIMSYQPVLFSSAE
jgi:hypothetical protein